MSYSLLTHPQSYQISLLDGLLSGATLFSGVPYAVRHGELITGQRPEGLNKKQVVWHASAAFLEFLPIVGGLCALIERIVIFIYESLLQNSNSQSQPPSKTLSEREIEKFEEEPNFDGEEKKELASKKMFALGYEKLIYVSTLGEGAIAVAIKKSPENYHQTISDFFNESISAGLRSTGGLASAVPVWTSFNSEYKTKGTIDEAIQSLFTIIGRNSTEKIKIKLEYCYVDRDNSTTMKAIKFARSAPMYPTSD